MDATSFALAALRLAPRQCAGWGHPVTTGHATIDVFFTCARHGAARRRRALHRTAGEAAGHRHALSPNDPADCRRRRASVRAAVRRAVAAVPAVAVQDSSGQRRVVRARARARVPDAMLVLFAEAHPAITDRFMRRLAGELRAPRPVDPRAHARVAAALRTTTSCASISSATDARHAALVGRQHQPRRARVRAADRDAARTVHARAPERGHAAR